MSYDNIILAEPENHGDIPAGCYYCVICDAQTDPDDVGAIASRLKVCDAPVCAMKRLDQVLGDMKCRYGFAITTT